MKAVTSMKPKPAGLPRRAGPGTASSLAPHLPERPFPNPLTICEVGPDGWTLLVNPDTGAAIAVNPTGALIWKLADGRRTVGDIVAGVRRRFHTTPGCLADDVAGLLGTFSDAGLIGEEIRARDS